MTYVLQAIAYPFRFFLPPGERLVLGRQAGVHCHVPVPTVSRHHAVLEAQGGGVLVQDTASQGGVWVDGDRVEQALLTPGVTVRFANIEFRLEAHVPGEPTSEASETVALGEDERRLAHLLDVAIALTRVGGAALLAKVAEFSFALFRADRCTILLAAPDGTLTPAISRDKRGAEAPASVPRSIVRQVMEGKTAIRADDAGQDDRFRDGASVIMQQVRSVMVAPLLGSNGEILGILYVDNFVGVHAYSASDLTLLEAFAGLAAAAIENSQLAERVRQQAVARSNFERFFTPQLAARIAESPDASRLGGDRRTVAVLFSDIRGFTSLSEHMEPDALAALLSEYFTEMVECVFRHEGTLDKFIGDAIMAQWGAPLGGPRDADLALAAAMDMQQALATLNARWQAEHRPTLQVGIGLNFGEVFAGNIGSERRLEFTVIGDTVNTASRLCSSAGPGDILLSAAFQAALSRKPSVSAMPSMALKGKQREIDVFRIID